MRIATWNVNSIKARLGLVLDWLKTTSPDVALFQEIKTIDENFPALEIGDLGYNFVCFGQKSYNGVAILSKTPIEDVERGLDGDPNDAQARYIEALVYGAQHPVRVASIYLPNGNPLGSEKFTYKLGWMERLRAHAEALLQNEEIQVLAGDYNVIPTSDDCHDPRLWMNDALFQPESRAGLRKIGISDLPTPIAPATRRRIATHSGTIKPAPGKRTMASASISRCCLRKRPIA